LFWPNWQKNNEKSWQHCPAASAVRRCGEKRAATSLQHKYRKHYYLFITRLFFEQQKYEEIYFLFHFDDAEILTYGLFTLCSKEI
jgi:hypothetical protein